MAGIPALCRDKAEQRRIRRRQEITERHLRLQEEWERADEERRTLEKKREEDRKWFLAFATMVAIFSSRNRNNPAYLLMV